MSRERRDDRFHYSPCPFDVLTCKFINVSLAVFAESEGNLVSSFEYSLVFICLIKDLPLIFKRVSADLVQSFVKFFVF